MTSRGRLVAVVVIIAAWFGLAIVSLLRGAVWFVPVCYAVCGLVMVVVFARMVSSNQSGTTSAGSSIDVGRARRSGNPAIRAKADDQRPDGG